MFHLEHLLPLDILYIRTLLFLGQQLVEKAEELAVLCIDVIFVDNITYA